MLSVETAQWASLYCRWVLSPGLLCILCVICQGVCIR
jgi:hypothetical protein